MTIHLMSVRSLGFMKAQGVKSMFDRRVPRKPRLVGGVERPNGSRGTMKNEISFPGSPALWAGSFTLFQAMNCLMYDVGSETTYFHLKAY